MLEKGCKFKLKCVGYLYGEYNLLAKQFNRNLINSTPTLFNSLMCVLISYHHSTTNMGSLLKRSYALLRFNCMFS